MPVAVTRPSDAELGKAWLFFLWSSRSLKEMEL